MARYGNTKAKLLKQLKHWENEWYEYYWNEFVLKHEDKINWNWLSELKQRQNVQPVKLDRFRQLLRQELEKDKSLKSALHAG